MKILTIIGSPRKKGNSYQAAKKLEEEMKKKGDYQFEYVFLKMLIWKLAGDVSTVCPGGLNSAP
ncbi:NAD(P)H-dependent oxidoreductase [Methanobacterium sp.]|jgi:NAD(P)H-dependent FMN reductase|uniref:NAD(P)H-dependent oxidoreductase n=1 Tax=Methanobacterium sp. TaxID=2164 RepID=UPI00258CD85B|nr:NAD(P)H-dependent oxidoreductase [Methanobacterium sp.]